MPVLHPEVFSTQKVVKIQKTEVFSKQNFNLVGKIRISIKIFLSIGMSTSTITNGAFQLYLYKDLQIA